MITYDQWKTTPPMEYDDDAELELHRAQSARDAMGDVCEALGRVRSNKGINVRTRRELERALRLLIEDCEFGGHHESNLKAYLHDTLK